MTGARAVRERSAGGRGRSRPALTLVKLGGSLLTDKRGVESPRGETIARLAAEVAAACRVAPGSLVLGHGSGSFGHALASRHGLSGGHAIDAPAAAVAAVQDSARRLHPLVLDALRTAGAAPVSFAPSACLVARGSGFSRWPAAPVRAALAAGALPVLYGDVVLDARGRARVCSTEHALAALARSLLAAGDRIVRAVWLGDTDGVLDERGERIPEVDARAGSPGPAGGAAGTDVTGGMAHRVAMAARLAADGVPSWIADGNEPGALRAALEDRAGASGTWVRQLSRTEHER